MSLRHRCAHCTALCMMFRVQVPVNPTRACTSDLCKLGSFKEQQCEQALQESPCPWMTRGYALAYEIALLPTPQQNTTQNSAAEYSEHCSRVQRQGHIPKGKPRPALPRRHAVPVPGPPGRPAAQPRHPPPHCAAPPRGAALLLAGARYPTPVLQPQEFRSLCMLRVAAHCACAGVSVP